MIIKYIGKIADKRQDGAIWNGFLFSFNHCGECVVYDLKRKIREDNLSVFSEFVLDRADEIVPHSNSVSFGKEYYDKNDEFPLLYTNIYNNYANSQDKMKGVTLVYRIQRNDAVFKSTLVQIIEIGFSEDETYWKSAGTDDIRPYGNFAIDRKCGVYYAFTMRDESKTTRYFSFDLPKVSDGVNDEKFDVKRKVLNIEDIKEYFDCDYHHFMQGATFYDGKIYSAEGFTNSDDNPPAMRVIDTNLKKETKFIDFVKTGYKIEPELIDFDGDRSFYSDHKGNLYEIEF